MSTLDDKLREILNGLGAPYGIQESSRITDHVEKVKQAFEEAGYAPPLTDKTVTEIVAKMEEKQRTYGEFFYERFRQELSGVWDGRKKAITVYNQCVQAAKKAAGLEEKK